MRYSYLFENKISTETVQELINTVHGYEEVDLYVMTEGGEIAAMTALVDYLNRRKESVKIYIKDYCMSAGTILLTDFKGDIELCEDLDFLMFHVWDYKEYNLRHATKHDRIIKKQFAKGNEEFSKKLKNLGLNQKEVSKFLKGKDVVIYRKDFNRINLSPEWK